MAAVICTLFEGHYHHGVAALANSLYQHGYRGEIFVGYRGELTSWAAAANNNSSFNWPGAKTLEPAPGLQIYFLPIDTHFHFTTYKPYFMLEVMQGVAKHANGIMYFDPDIVIKCKWEFFEKWITFGVGLVHEIVNHDMPPNNPMRFMWREIIEKSGRKVTRNLYAYINGGYCGVSRNNIEFIKAWIDIINVAINHYNFDPATMSTDDKTFIFGSDQDGLNIAAMCSESPISEMGPQAMDFIFGGFTMSHANNSPKPWKKKFIYSALKGIVPSIQEKEFWLYTSNPIPLYTKTKIRNKRRSIAFAKLIGRFYKRS